VIVTRRGGALQLVEQAEHGRLAGELAAAWGNETFTRPTPLSAVRTAAARHDDGWRTEDARVLFNELERRPLHFLEIEAGAHIRLYRQGVEQVSAADVYAGVLVGMHWTGLYRGRWSAPGAAARVGRDADDRRKQDRVVAGEERRWIEAKQRAWHEDEPRSVFETGLWHNYELLQLWDLLSLYLSVMPPDQAGTGSAAVPWGQQLRALEHDPQDVLLPAVAVRPGADRAPLTATLRRPGEVVVDPFPFSAPLEVQVEHTLLPDRPGTRAEVRSRMRRTPRTTTTWRLVPAAGRRS
jgi:hypothetical protein